MAEPTGIPDPFKPVDFGAAVHELDRKLQMESYEMQVVREDRDTACNDSDTLFSSECLDAQRYLEQLTRIIRSYSRASLCLFNATDGTETFIHHERRVGSLFAESHLWQLFEYLESGINPLKAVATILGREANVIQKIQGGHRARDLAPLTKQVAEGCMVQLIHDLADPSDPAALAPNCTHADGRVGYIMNDGTFFESAQACFAI